MENIRQIRKRNGDIVPFDQAKVTKAILKAFIAVRGSGYEGLAEEVSSKVVGDVSAIFSDWDNGKIPMVEQIQDIVEKNLMDLGFFDVARAYIIYRFERAKAREEAKLESLEKIKDNALTVLKRDGHRDVFSVDKLKKSLSYVVRGYEKEIDVSGIINQLKLEVYDGIPTSDIDKAITMVVRSMIERDPAYSYVSARLMLRQIYEEVIGDVDWANLTNQYREAFKNSIKKGVEINIFDKRMVEFNLDELAKAIDPMRDDIFEYLGIATLYDRYFAKDVSGTKKIIELPQTFWMRVAMGISLLEKNKEASAVEFYDVLSSFKFSLSTPSLFHSGTTHPQLSSCYLNTVGDTLESIFKVYGDNAQMSKYAGGIGMDWSYVRGTGSLIKRVGIESQGVIPFLKIANDVTIAINRSGRRRGAAAVYLETWHYDIEDFLELRKNTGDERRRTHDMSTANWIPDLFMKRVREDADWTLFSPDETPELHDLYGKKFEAKYEEYEAKALKGEMRLYKKIKARDLWKKMINMLYETGHPWITFKDPCNLRSPQDHVGVIHNSNLCTEIALNNSLEETAVCNLGSINLAVHIKDKKLDDDLVAQTIKTGMRMLDNVIDVNFYPTNEGKVSNLRHRPVGLGMMGFHDALYLMDVNFDSDEAVKFSDESMELISYCAIMASSTLAKERGTYETYKGSKWDRGIFPVDTVKILEEERGISTGVPLTEKLDWKPVREHVKKYGMRNSNCMAIAPTATTSNILGSIPSTEPIYKNIYVKSNISGDFTVINPYLVEDLKKINLWDDEMIGKIKFNDGGVKNIIEIPEKIRSKYKETFEISPEWIIKQAAYRGKWIDQSQSVNVFYAGTSGREIANIYDYAWELGLKTTYYLRTLGASQVEKSTVSTAEFGSTHKRTMPVAEIENAPAASVENLVVETSKAKEVNPVSEAVDDGKPKLCKILDPECESCQ